MRAAPPRNTSLARWTCVTAYQLRWPDPTPQVWGGSTSVSPALAARSQQVPAELSGANAFAGARSLRCRRVCRCKVAAGSSRCLRRRRVTRYKVAAGFSRGLRCDAFAGARSQQVPAQVSGADAFAGARLQQVPAEVSGANAFAGARLQQQRSQAPMRLQVQGRSGAVAFAGARSQQVPAEVSGADVFAGARSQQVPTEVSGALTVRNDTVCFKKEGLAAAARIQAQAHRLVSG